MKHAKFYMMLVFISFCAYAQNRPGIDYYPHISFFDFSVQYLHPPHGNQASIKTSVELNDYYYPYLKKLGITNLVTDWDEYSSITQSPNPATDFFINDMGFSWRDMPNISYFGPANYLSAFGHFKDNYTLQFGGTQVTNLTDDNNFGFGAGTNAESYWCMTDETKPPGDMDVIGENTEDDGIWVRAATMTNDDNGLLLWGGLPWTQFYYGDMDYYIDIKLKKVPTSGNPRLFKLVAQLQEDEIEPIPTGYQKRPPIIPEQTIAPLTNVYLEQDVFWDDITHNAGVYDWFRSNSFRIAQGKNLQFHIYWYNESDLYVDQVAIYNEKYRDAFITNAIDFQTDVVGPLQDAYQSSMSDNRLQDFYYDEPFMLTARSRGILQNAIPTILGSSTNVHVNGATGSLPEYFLHFDHKYAKVSQNAPHKNYVLFNMYPFGETCPYDQTTVQNKLNDLIECSSFGGSHLAYSYNYAGLLPSQIAAQQYDTEPENDLPLFMTLQVHAEHELDEDGKYIQNLVRGKRPPTKDEIFAMGNVSLAYGVKGFMYYMVPTRSEVWGDGTHWGTYGLFDQNEPPKYPKYNYITKAGTWQNPAQAQDTNERYTAVREFISSVKPIESTLLKLRWLDAKGWNRTETSTINWINSVSTALDSNFTQADATPMVETGYFEEYHSTGYNPNAKYLYVVNKRCNSNINGESSRYVAMEVNYGIFQGRSNLKFTDLKSGRIYYTKAEANVVIFLRPGDGTLFKIEPTLL